MRALNDIVLDTNILADTIAVYYENKVSLGKPFDTKYRLSSNIVNIYNRIIQDYSLYGFSTKGVVVASSFAFVELGRKFDIISAGRFTLDQFKAFLFSPPEWFVIDSLSENLFGELHKLPAFVSSGQNTEQVEWADALHCATAMARGENSLLATSDSRLEKIQILEGRIIN